MEFKDNHPIYLQIAHHFFENILQKKWEEGEKIPSIRDMAVQFEVNPNTTMRTFNFLQERGIIFNKRGIGYFVAEDGYKKTLELKKEEFIKQDLPVFFQNMNLLKLSFEHLQEYYNEFKNRKI